MTKLMLVWSAEPSSCDWAYCLISTTLEVSYNSIRITNKCCIVEGVTAYWTPTAVNKKTINNINVICDFFYNYTPTL